MPMAIRPAPCPLRVVDNHDKYGYFYGLYLQDEWKPFEQLTINFGGRLDFVNAFADENQLSPADQHRVRAIEREPRFTRVTPDYFTPPPLDARAVQITIAKFAGTTMSLK